MVDITALAGLFALVSSMLLQVLKPFVERIPGIMLPANNALHDSLLRLVLYGINFLLLVAAMATPGTGLAGAGLQWFDLVALAFGQSVLSHGNFSLATGPQKASTPLPTIVETTLAPTSASTAPPAA